MFVSIISILQFFGGVLFFLNKLFFAIKEKLESQDHMVSARYWEIVSWVVYILGLFPWLRIFFLEKNWIAMSVEASGLPSMVLGLYNAYKGRQKSDFSKLEWAALAFVPIGFIVSFLDFKGFGSSKQWLETGLVAGYLPGTYLLASGRGRVLGYLFYISMHMFCAALMGIQNYPWLVVGQILSIPCVIYAIFMMTKTPEDIGIDFGKMNGLIFAEAKDIETKETLMAGVMNRRAYEMTVQSNHMTLWSRTRKKLWTKGETSGNYLNIVRILLDCDQDTIVCLVQPVGPTCHTGAVSCFENKDGSPRIIHTNPNIEIMEEV